MTNVKYQGDPYVLHELLGANMIEYRMAEAVRYS